MKRVILATISTIAALVLLLSFKSHTVSANPVTAAVRPATPTATATATSGSGSDPTASPSASSSASTPSAATSSAATTAGTTAKTGTYTGDSVDTRWGPVQVQITVTNGKITAATAVEYPENNGRDQQINAYAVPTLEQETVTAGNANIDMVSGATYTSDGYISSLQSALDKAGLS